MKPKKESKEFTEEELNILRYCIEDCYKRENPIRKELLKPILKKLQSAGKRDYVEFRIRLKEEMKLQDMTVKVLAEKSDIKESTIRNYLKTNGPQPDIDKALKISQSLNISLDRLATGKEYQENIE